MISSTFTMCFTAKICPRIAGLSGWVTVWPGLRRPRAATVAALGLRKVGQTVEQPDNPAVRGQIFAVKHMLKVEEVK